MKAVLILASLGCLVIVSFAATDKIVCYFDSESAYRSGYAKFYAGDINTDLCTHTVYMFLGLNDDGTIKITDHFIAIDIKGLEYLANLRLRNPSIKVLMGIGGREVDSSTFSAVVNNPTRRTTFVNSVVNYVSKYGYDGIDLHWEYPGVRGGVDSDRAAFVTLLKELRPHFDQNGWLLTATVGAILWFHEVSYDVPKLNQYLDLIYINAYDFHGPYELKTGHNAPLYPSDNAINSEQRQWNIESVIGGWIWAGADREKLILGMSAYGRTFTLSDPSTNGINAPSEGPGTPGPYTLRPGFMSYPEICQQEEMGFTKVWDDEQQRPYIYKGDQWICYDDVKAIEVKSQFAVTQRLGGVAIWSIDADDSTNFCGKGKFPLLTAINNVLKAAVSTTTEPSIITNTTENPNVVVCQGAGYIRDPLDCKKFYICEPNGNEFTPTSFSCATGLLFDAVLGMCNWASQVLNCLLI